MQTSISKIMHALLLCFTLVGTGFLVSGAAHAQTAPQPPIAPQKPQVTPQKPAQSDELRPGSNKPVPPSASRPVTQKKPAHLYPASSQETADSILADSLDDLFEQTDAHFHEGEYNHVVNLNRIVVQGDPHRVEAYSNSAWLLWSSARNDEAITTLKVGIKANPNSFYMYDELGNHYLLNLKDPVSALPYFEQAVRFSPPTFTTWQNLARCYEKSNQWDKAVEAWRKATFFPQALRADYFLKRAIAERDKRKAQ